MSHVSIHSSALKVHRVIRSYRMHDVPNGVLHTNTVGGRWPRLLPLEPSKELHGTGKYDDKTKNDHRENYHQ